MDQDYAKAFRIIRAAFGLQQSELAARMGVSASQLSLIEAGKRQPSLRIVNALAKAVGVPSALISLLASTSDEVASTASEEITDLARALLRLLVAAKPDPQRSLHFQE
jgi:transcriptional regulator with XRE-family HTH domain